MTEHRNPTILRVTRRHAIIGGILACASGLAFARQPEVSKPTLEADLFETLVPETFAGWSVMSRTGVVLPPPDTLRDRLYDNLVTRVYQHSGAPPIMLLLAYNNEQDGVLQVHRPEVCYPVGGFDLTETRNIELGSTGNPVPGNIFTASSPGRVEQVAYFTRLGDAYPRSWAEQRIAVMRANLNGDIPDGMMMRVSVLDVDQAKAKPLLTSFTREFIDASPRRLQQLLLG